MKNKLYAILASCIVSLSGCAATNNSTSIDEKQNSISKNSPAEEKINNVAPIKKKQKDFEIEFSQERKIVLLPTILKDGSIISKREITLLPKFPTWINKEDSISNSKVLSKYYNEKTRGNNEK